MDAGMRESVILTIQDLQQPQTKQFKQANHLWGRVSCMLEKLMIRMKWCDEMSYDKGKLFMEALVDYVT